VKNKDNINNLQTGNKKTTGNSGLAKVAVSFSADTFVVKESSVLRINICGKNRQLLVAAKRYGAL
jgi:hypothetical protein